MLTSRIVSQQLVDELSRDDQYRYVFSFNPYADPIHLLSAWKWLGMIGPRTYVVGQRREDVDNAPVFASTASSTASGGTRTALPCNGQRVAVPGGEAPTVVSARHSGALRILVRADLAPLPRVGTIYSHKATKISCNGRRAIAVVTAPTNAA